MKWLLGVKQKEAGMNSTAADCHASAHMPSATPDSDERSSYCRDVPATSNAEGETRYQRYIHLPVPSTVERINLNRVQYD